MIQGKLNLIKKLLVFLRNFIVVTSITFIFLEILLRISPFALGNQPSSYQPSEEYGWGLIPNTEYSHTVEGNRVVVRINNKGLRDIDHDYRKPKNTFRILFLGDSFTEAKQVNLEETFVKVLENKLNQYVEYPVEVINSGVSAYGTDNELLFYQNEGFKYQADLVFVMFYFNDVGDNTKTAYFTIQDDQLMPIETKPDTAILHSGDSPIEKWLWQNIETYRIYLLAIHAFRELEKRMGNSLYNPEQQVELSPYWDLTQALFEELQSEIAEDNATMILVHIPSSESLETSNQNEGLDHSLISVRITDISDQLGLHLIDLYLEFPKAVENPASTLYLKSDGHLNAVGHSLVSDIIAKYLFESNLITIPSH